ncbi:MAG TPA: glycoside hydrolase family 130 protein [Cyclobacteriaceae bacterium]|nr:glycoside hydrolase family 130 protein [Cyclobacteriaceae bacterium]
MKKLIQLFLVLVGAVNLVGSCNTNGNSPTINYEGFIKPIENPIVRADSNYTFLCPMKNKLVRWQKADVFNPAAIVKDGKVMLLYRCEDNPAAHLGGRTSRIGLAESADGIRFRKFPTPVLYPGKDDFSQYDAPGGCEDPRVVVTEGGMYVMTYTSWNYETPRLSIAFSRDLITWEKKGPAFEKAYEGKFKNIASKSGSILTKRAGNNFVAAKVNGRYWMYWGELGVNLAWSENLYDWFPELNEHGGLHYLIEPRKGKFDSNLTECGPPALITEEGVVLIYNGKNSDSEENATRDFPRGTYSVGRVVFNSQDLRMVVDRSEKPFLYPTLPHEVQGQYKAGTTFAEGLVFFKGKWFLYYGTADSFVGLTVAK